MLRAMGYEQDREQINHFYWPEEAVPDDRINEMVSRLYLSMNDVNMITTIGHVIPPPNPKYSKTNAPRLVYDVLKEKQDHPKIMDITELCTRFLNSQGYHAGYH
jgi:hypothetical protein